MCTVGEPDNVVADDPPPDVASCGLTRGAGTGTVDEVLLV